MFVNISVPPLIRGQTICLNGLTRGKNSQGGGGGGGGSLSVADYRKETQSLEKLETQHFGAPRP